MRNDHSRDQAARQPDHKSSRPQSRRAGDQSQANDAKGRPFRASKEDPARNVAYTVLRSVTENDAYANLALPPLIRRFRLSARDAALATELTYGALRMRGAYDAILRECVDRSYEQVDSQIVDVLRLGAHQILAMRIPVHAAVSQTVGLARSRVGQGGSSLVNAVLRRVSERNITEWFDRVAPSAAEDLIGHLAITRSHPAWVVRAFKEALASRGVAPAELDAELTVLLDADNAAPAVTLVARPGVAKVSDLVQAGATPGQWSPLAARWSGDPGSLVAVRESRAGVQDEGSQLMALALAAVPLLGRDARWLDLCAGPGGKTAVLGGLAAQWDARVTAVEVAPHRADLVRAATAGLARGIVEVQVGDGREYGNDQPGEYDRVLVDAPCTGLGALRRRPEARWRRTPTDLSALGPLQRDLLRSAVDATRRGGVVAYVTCSPHPAETDLVVRDVMRRRDDLELMDAVAVLNDVALTPLPDIGGSASRMTSLSEQGMTAQLWPHRHGTDAMYLAILRRR
ncbi:MAG: RsmB/NOP family class I SAM-dependent RNA methyltransferase [Actinomycetota bacterium]